MDLPELGNYLHERSHLKIVDLTFRFLGFTAIAIEALLDEINDEEISQERWGIQEGQE